jgi:hypothetical protein
MRTFYPALFAANTQYCAHGKACPGCCWRWLGWHDGRGWPRLGTTLDGHWYYKAHRYLWHLTRGIAPTHAVGHTCGTRGCVNPAHLRRTGGPRGGPRWI